MKLLYLCCAASALLPQLTRAQEKTAMTMWWVIFNNPDACITAPEAEARCGVRDIFGDAFLGSVNTGTPDPSLLLVNSAAHAGLVYATGGLSDEDGKVSMSASVYLSENPLDVEPAMDPLELGVGWNNTDAEIHLLIRSHGLADAEGYPLQITDFFEPYCDAPNLQIMGELADGNICEDIQDVVSPPGVSGELTVNGFDAARTPVEGARAFFFRRDDAIQAIVETVVPVPVPTSPTRATPETTANSMWWVIFNNPEACITAPDEEARCGSRDAFGDVFLASVASGTPDPSLLAPTPEVDVGLIYAGGGLADNDGKLFLVASIYRSTEPLALEFGMDPLELGQGLNNTDAEIHLLVRNHGVAEEEDYITQITNIVDPYCIDPGLQHVGSMANGNICTDMQDVISPPGTSGEFPVRLFDAERTSVGRAFINRRGDGVQAVLETFVPVPNMTAPPSTAPPSNTPPSTAPPSTAPPSTTPPPAPPTPATSAPETTSGSNMRKLSLTVVMVVAVLVALL